MLRLGLCSRLPMEGNMFSATGSRAARRARRKEEEVLRDLFCDKLSDALVEEKVPVRALVEIGENLVSRNYFCPDAEPSFIEAYRAKRYADEAYIFLGLAGWEVARSPNLFFRQPEEVVNILAYALEAWYGSIHASNLDVEQARIDGFPRHRSCFVRAATRGVRRMRWSRISFVRKG